MRLKDKITGIIKLSFAENQQLPNHDFRGQPCFNVKFENLGTLVMPLDAMHLEDFVRCMIDDTPVDIDFASHKGT